MDNIIRPRIDRLQDWINQIETKILIYLRTNLILICILLIVTSAAYGFELFNMNLTIDEELASLQSGMSVWNLASGRWGKFIISNILFENPILPFLPLALALFAQMASILLFIEIFKTDNFKGKLVVGTLGMTYPGMVFMYSFSTANYLVGIGLFCITFSLYLFSRNTGIHRWFSVLPAVLALGTYQPLLPPFLALNLVYFIDYWNRKGLRPIFEVSQIILVISLSLAINFCIQQFLLMIYHVSSTAYVEHFIDAGYLFDHTDWVFLRLGRQLLQVYTGDSSIFGFKIRSFGVFLLGLFLVIIKDIFTGKRTFPERIIAFFLVMLLISMPFLGGIFTRGLIPVRSLLAVPVVLIGLTHLAINRKLALFQTVMGLLAVICLFQFISSANHLFASSSISLQQDRVLGTQLITRIEEAKENCGLERTCFFEMIGYIDREPSPLVSKIDVIGASFFGWDQGHSARAVAFLKILGYDNINALPLERRGDYIAKANEMPLWPAIGSVQVVGDVVLVKFGDYSPNQRQAICQSSSNGLPGDFCSGPSQ